MKPNRVLQNTPVKATETARHMACTNARPNREASKFLRVVVITVSSLTGVDAGLT